MRFLYYLITFLLFFSLFSCLGKVISEKKQVYPNRDLSLVHELHLYNHHNKKTRITIDPKKIKRYSNFLKDSTNYYKNESIDKEVELKATYGLTYISKKDTLDLTIHPSEKPDKVVVTFFDPYDPNDHWKFRRYNRFYLRSVITDSLESNWK